MNHINPFRLDGKTILITGASSGIGRATAIECSRLGARLIISGRNEQRLEETLQLLNGTDHKMIVGDLTIESELERIVAETASFDGLVLCSGKGMMLPMQFSTREKFMDVFDSNFFYPLELLRLSLKKKKLI